MSEKLEKIYNPTQVEDKIYSFWMNGNFFHANIDQNKKSYTIVIPPPNITGKLHMGHALDETLQDILIRFKRMQGYCALWVPGTDHASIATEAKIVDFLKQEGLTKEGIGREEFLKRAWEWKEIFGGQIIEQLKKLGCSCDWERERFTLDEGCSEAVNEVFVNLYKKGLIYRGERIINWCSKCKTSISDAEVEFDEHEGFFWHIKYPVKGEDKFLTIATTRPETMLGDTAVAVHSDDQRYKNLIGKTVILPLLGREIPIIADNYVEQDFGTGAVKITPAHDPNDFEVGLRHNLDIINIMDDKAVMNDNAGKYKGLDRFEARKAIIEDLKNQDLIVKIEPIQHNVGSCYRCSTIVEPRVSKQWFVKMQPLAAPAIKSVKNKETNFVPERFEKIYYHWMENIKDWCISRQLWWGHRIPAWYCNDCGNMIVSSAKPETCPKCKSNSLKQDEDTLDTWFSSALWPFSTLGWPKKTEDLKYFYPTDTLVTGYDIIFFWVARMIFSAIEHTDEVPFKTVFIHGLVRDSKGRKMSKSLGNGIDPLDITKKYGADALRFALVTGNSPGNDMRFTDEKVESSRNFANKIWNAARFIHMNIDEHSIDNTLPKTLNPEDKWVIHLFNELVQEVTNNLDRFELGLALQKLYEFIWDSFCDWYIEFAKIRIMSDSSKANNTRQVLVWVFTNILKLLHPFMPFITEKLWLSFPHSEKSIMISAYPEYKEEYNYTDSFSEIQIVIDAIKKIRNRRSEMNIPPSKKAKIYINSGLKDIYLNNKEFILKLAFARQLEVSDNIEIKDAVIIVTDKAKIYIPMDELIDKEAEKARLDKELQSALKELEICENKLNNKGFMSKAPEQVIKKVSDNLRTLKEKIKSIESAIAAI